MARVFLIIVAVLVLLVLGGGAALWFWYQNAIEGIPGETLEVQYVTEDDRFVQVSGARVRVREQGPADAPPLVLIHGFTFSLESFDAWADALDDDFRVIRYDLLGHGLTGPDPQSRYAPAERAAFLGELLDVLDIERASIAGNSLGGLVAWRFAALEPNRVERLILIDAGAYSINNVTDTPVCPPPSQVEASLRTGTLAVARFYLELVYANDDLVNDERAQEVSDMMRRAGNGQAFVDHICEFVLPDPEPDLENVTAPTLILWGGQDILIPSAHAAQLEAAIPNAEAVVFDALGHAPQEEDPAGTVAVAEAFLRGR